MTIQPGKDHCVYDSKGKLIAVLLKSRCKDELTLERIRKAYERGTGAPVSVRPSFDKGEK